MEALLILANVIQRFQLSIPTDLVVVPEGLATLQAKTPITVTLQERVSV